MDDFEKFYRGYVTAALWSTTDDDDTGSNSLLDNYDPSDLSQEAAEEMKADCKAFMEENEELLLQALPLYNVTDGSSDWDYAGHDFWLTRNGHGVGFWDRGFGDLGDKLTDACKEYSEVYIYAGDDDKIYV